jgi:hypothetical protein
LFSVCLFFCTSESFEKLGLPPEKKNGGKLWAGPPIIEILDDKYDKANLPEIVKDTCPHLEPSQRDMLLSLLLDYESLLDGTLGDWNRPPVSIELKDGAKPFHGRPYPIPQIHKGTLMKKIDRLMDRSSEEAIIVTMGLSDNYNPKEGCHPVASEMIDKGRG